MSIPIELKLNAWTGSESAKGGIGDPAEWALTRKLETAPRLLAPTRADPLDWRSREIGWGVVLADGVTIPPPLQQLISDRKAPVFRYIPNWEYSLVLLRNYAAGKDIDINAAPRGTASDALPQYLLIYGSPEEVPWRLQYVLNANRCVGRIHLTGSGLANYIRALSTGDWARSEASRSIKTGHALVWAVDHGESDITRLMREAIALPLWNELREDNQIGNAGARYIDGSAEPATVSALSGALAASRPGLIVTTSHGMTGPLDDREMMKRGLGLPVDSEHQTVSPSALLEKWQPAGAIWYSHACCSAGGDRESSFAKLFSPDTAAAKVLSAVASLGAQIAPLPTALLGAERPLRAFIGHVEPTFDWTLQQPATGQFLTSGLVEALYAQIYVSKGEVERPIGYAFREWYGRTNGLRSQYDHALNLFNKGEPSEGTLLALQLAARDIESTVILGDPTVAMPGLGP